MEKEKLDEFFNQKLPGRSFEPTEEYWKQAEALIEADEKKRRNWKFLWWGLGIFLLLGFAIGWNWNSNRFAADIEGQEISEVATDATNSISTEVDSKQNNQTLSEKEALKNINEENNTDASETNTKANDTAFATAQKNKKNTAAKEKVTSSVSTKTQKSKTVIDKGAEQLALKNNNTKNLSKTKNGNSDFIKNEKQTIKNADVTPQLNDQSLNNDSKNANSPTTVSTKSTEENQLSPNEKIETTSKKEKELANVFQMETLALTSLLFSMEELERDLDLGSPKPYESEYPKPRRRSFNLGVQGGVSLFPAKGNEKILNGWEGGLTAQYQLNKNWFIGADALYLKNIGTFNQSGLEVSQINYSFGSKTTSYDFERTSLSTVEVPLYVQYKMNQHRLEAGLGLNFLIGVRGALEKTESLLPWEREGDEMLSLNTTSEQKWVSKDGFKTFYPSLILGYRLEMTKRLDIGARARYVFARNNIGLNTEEEPELELYQEFRPLSFRVSLRYYFIK